MAGKAKKVIYAAQSLVRRKYGVRPDMMHWIWTGCIVPIVLYGCHLWAHNMSKTHKAILDKISYMALTSIAHCHKGTPLAGLQTILNTKPLDLTAKETALAALDRLQLHWRTIEPEIDDLPRGGHIKQLMDERALIVGNTVPDYDTAINKNSQFKILTRQAGKEDKSDYDIFTDGSKKQDGTGSAYTITCDNKEITYGQFSLNPEATVFQSELVALEMAAKRITELKLSGRVNIHSDSLSSLQALKADRVGPE
jgi:hypothetical protein